MDIDLSLVWLTLLLLGAFHGINPGMGWLFAVALGLQEQRREAVWRSLLPLALGHALAVGIAILLAGVIGLVIPLAYLKWIVAAVLFSLGVFHLRRHRHPRYGGMKVGLRDLTIWSFLMASAHGAGLMVLPFLFGAADMPDHAAHEAAPSMEVHQMHEPIAYPDSDALPIHTLGMEEKAGEGNRGGHANHAAMLLDDLPAGPMTGLIATLVHTFGYLLIIGLVAMIVYEKIGLRLLRKAWINLDLIWAISLIVTALFSLIL